MALIIKSSFPYYHSWACHTDHSLSCPGKKKKPTEQPMDQWRNQKRNLKNTLRQMKMKCNISVGCSKGNSKWELQNDTVLFQETMRNI